ncbi:MAG: NAD(P)/FAD-dependent oxidoreductase [Candidatus Cryosericum sp.]|jgi:nitrite reductase (NADH) large subunit
MNFLIAGGWAAGTAAAGQLRRLDPSATISIVDTEPVPYYSRPDLIDYLAGRKSKDQLFVHGAGWYDENHITLMSSRSVTQVHPLEHTCTLDDGVVLAYDRLLLANGASPFIPPLPGTSQADVFALRTLADADALLSRIEPGSNAVIVGGGVLGLEAARALTERGMTASVLEFAGRLLPNQLDEPAATMLREHLQSMGITAMLGVESQEVVSEDHGGTGILLKDGRIVTGNLVLFSTGVRPNVSIARAAGLAVGRGIQVDDTMLTSAADIYAAGDVAEHRGRVYGIIPPCLEQAKVAAQNMVTPGSATYQGSVMSNSLKIVGLDVLSIGNVNPNPAQGLEEIRMHSGRTYRKVVLENGALTGIILYGTTSGARPLQQALRAHADLSAFREQLARPDWDFTGI